jgi:hypothetical protein
MLTLTLKQETAWQYHLNRPELRRHLFYGGARSGKTDVILSWLCLQAAKYPGARILMARRMRIAAAKSLWSDNYEGPSSPVWVSGVRRPASVFVPPIRYRGGSDGRWGMP